MIVQFIAILFFAVFSDFLLPDGKYTKYISFVLGLILITVAIAPILSLKNIAIPTEWDITIPEIAEKEITSADGIFSQKLEEYLLAELGIKAEVNATVKEIISVKAEEGSKEEIAKLLGIAEEKVWITN